MKSYVDTVYRAKTRIQALPSNVKGKNKEGLSMLSVLLRVYREEGILGMYRGFGATMLNTFSMRACNDLAFLSRP